MKHDLEYRITKARTKLVLDHPFFGVLAMNMGTRIDARPDVPTAATDGENIYYNSAFCNTLDDQTLLFLVAHECMHPMLHHLTRRGDRDPMKWNIAGDVVINHYATEENIGTMPEGGVYEPVLFIDAEGITERIYDLIPDSVAEKYSGGGDGAHGLGDLLDPAGMTEAEQAELEAKWKVLASQAAQSAKMQGKLSAGLERFVSEILNPKVPWYELLQRFVVRCKNEQRTWRRMNRRMVCHGMYAPSVDGEAMGTVAIAIDVSGSVNEEELNQFAAEVCKIHEDLRPERIHIVWFEDDVSGTQDFGPDDTLTLKPVGCGGTRFSPIFKHIAEQDIDPVCCVVLTDLGSSDFGPAPEYPVMWVSTEKGEAPWGEVVFM